MVADSLRQSILDGAFAPGQRLMDSEIASRMGVSRSPVREALRQLEKDGLVCYTANRGCTVIDLSREDLTQLYGIRAVLEGLAAAWACQSIQDAHLSELKRLCCEMQALLPFQSDADRVTFLHKDAEFHELLIEAAGSPRLADTLAGVRLQIRMMMAAIIVAARASAQAAGEHALMVNALSSRNAEDAERLARRHVEDSRARMLRFLSS
jgi:DNA-binding GntR family transcriptional regulator